MIGSKPKGSIDVLLVEDNHGDVLLVRQALKAADAKIRLHVAMDGVAALDFIRSGNVRPDLVILDLNLPQKTGGEVLDELKADAEFSDIPVVVFSSSAAPADVRRAYRSQACGYIQKPTDVDRYFAVVAELDRYWRQTVVLPTA